MKKKGNINNINGRQKNMKKVVIAYVIGLTILIYFSYSIIQLIRRPTNIFMIEEGKLIEEENAVRVYYKR